MTGRFLALLALAAGCSGGGGSPPAQEQAFQIVQVTPPNGSDEVPLTAEINVVFSQPVDDDTLDDDTLQVVSESGTRIFGRRELAQFNPGVVRFLPIQPYDPLAVHEIRVSRGVKDRSGKPLDRDYVFEFETEPQGPDVPAPEDVEDRGDVLSVGRWFHRITRLHDGRFLVAGGYAFENSVTAIAEILDPSTGASDPIFDPLVQGRANHVQVLLPDGRVLLAGGETSDTPFLPTAICEIFDPATLQFTQATTMKEARTFASGVVLPDGRVLVTAGQGLVGGKFQLLSSAEVYDPVDDEWTLLDEELLARSSHVSALAPGGDVVVFGGVPGVPSGVRWNGTSFDPIVPGPLFDHSLATSAILPDGRPMLVGGFQNKGVTIWDPVLGFVAALNPMLEERAFASATPFPDGAVLIAGGTNFSKSPVIVSDTMDLFHPVGKTGQIVRVTGVALPVPTSHHAAAADEEGNIWLTGGIPLDLAFPALRRVTVIRPGGGD